MSEVEYLQKILETVELIQTGNLVICICVGLTLGFVVIQSLTQK